MTVLADRSAAKVAAGSDVDLWLDWFVAVRDLPGNPYGIEIRRVGSAAVLHAHEIPLPYYNRVMGLADREHYLAGEIADFFRRRSTPFRFDVYPFDNGPRLEHALRVLGFDLMEHQANLYGAPRAARRSSTGVDVRRVRREEIDSFAELYDRAYHHGRRVPTRLARFRRDAIRARFMRPQWRYYIAMIDGVEAAGAMLHINDSVASLAGAATSPDMRSLGCQSALLRHRILEARQLGCSTVISRCAADSTSERNLVRAGLWRAFSKTVWYPQAL